MPNEDVSGSFLLLQRLCEQTNNGVNENRLGVIQAQFQVRTHQQFNMGQNFEINIICQVTFNFHGHYYFFL
jgi:hypothetical protein